MLRDVVWYDDPIYFTPHRTTGSAAMYRDACARGAEGIIAKRADSRYVGTRSGDWLKIKCVLQQEFVIGGYTAPQGSREHLGALLVGYYEGGDAALRRQGRHRLRRGHAAPAAPEARTRWPAARRPSLPARSPRAKSTGSRRSSSPRSDSASGPRPGCCAIRATSGSGTTRRPRRCGGRDSAALGAPVDSSTPHQPAGHGAAAAPPATSAGSSSDSSPSSASSPTCSGPTCPSPASAS